MSEPEIGIAAVAYHLPGPRCDLLEWAPAHDVSEARVRALIDNGCRYFHEGPEHSDSELIAAAIHNLAPANSGWLRSVLGEVRYLLHAHTEAFSMPAPPSSIISELAAQFDLRLTLGFSVCQVACASVIQAIARAAQLLAADPDARYALVVTSDRVFGDARHRLRQQSGIQSDGGSAILLARANAGVPLECRLGTASFKNCARLHDGPVTPANAAAIARYTWLHTKQLFQQHSQASGLALDAVACFLPVNADRDYWMRIARSLQLPDERFFLDNIGARGHACCADLAVNLIDAGLHHVRQGSTVVACGQSNVGAYAALTLLPAQGNAA